MKKSILILCYLFCLTSASYSQRETETDKLNPTDFTQIFQLAIDFPSLEKHFQAVNDSIGKQIIFQYFGEVNHDNLKGVTKFGKNVIILSKEEIIKRQIKYYFVVGDWVCTTDSVRLQLSYVGEGSLISYRFTKTNNVWTLHHAELNEE